MSNRYEILFDRLKENGGKAFIPYMMLGFPSRELCLNSIQTMIDAGAHALELGLAFSDPLADGPAIQAASAATIESGFKTKDALELIQELRWKNPDIPITLMCYYNSVLAHQLSGFCKRAKDAGADGLLVVDLPAQEAAPLAQHCKANGLSQIFIISPLTTKERIASITEFAGGFLYVVSRLGITGVEERYDAGLQDLIADAKHSTKLPMVVGFGVSSPCQAERMFSMGADAVITGSRIVNIVSDIHAGKADLQTLQEFVQSMLSVTNTARCPG